MFCEKYYKKLLNYAKKDQIWADPNCPYRGSLWHTLDFWAVGFWLLSTAYQTMVTVWGAQA